MKSQGCLNWVCFLVLVAFGTSNLTGCSVVSLVETSRTIEAGTETRQTQKLVKKDVELVFTPKKEKFIVRLQRQPHYRALSRSIKKPSKSLMYSWPIIGVGLAEISFLGLYLFEASEVDSLKDEGVRTKSQTDKKLLLYDDDLKPKSWVNKTALGVGFDVLLSVLILTRDRKQSYTPWKTSGTVPGKPQPIRYHPVSISLPQFQYQSTYETNADGNITISARELSGQISNLDPVLDDKRIEVVASVKVDGQRQFETFLVNSWTSGTLFQALSDEADNRRKALPADLHTQVAFSDSGDFIPNNILDAGERNGKLQVTVNNNGQGPGFAVKLHLSTDHPGVQLQEQAKTLGNIEPNSKKTVVIPITTSLQATDGFANIRVEAKEIRGYDSRKLVHRLAVSRLRPFSLAIPKVEVNDRTLGNGNGIMENGETIELKVFIHNGGNSNALDTRLELADINQGLDVQVQSANLGTIRPKQTVQGFLRFHIPRTFAESAVECKLRVNELRFDATQAAPLSQTKSYSVKQLAPSLEIDYRLVADDNGDGKIQQGEQIEFELTVNNIGNLDALNTRLGVSVSDSRIRIIPSERTSGKLAPNYSSSPQRFSFIIPRAVPPGELSILVEVTQDDFPKVERTFNLMVYEEEISVTR